jgi:hypothetical protein
MKRFSFKVFAGAAFLHIVGTIWLIGASISRIEASGRGETFRWLTALSWIWMPIPVFLGHFYLHFGPARFLYYLAFPWSLFVAVCCGFLVPYFSRWRGRLA